MAAEKEEVTLFNQGQRTYHTRAGALKPGESIAVSKEEAKNLLGYHDIVDFARIAPKTQAKLEELAAENEKLKAANEKLQSDADEAEGSKAKGKK